MELEILQENLNRGLGVVTRVLTSRPQMAILSNILLKAQTGRLEIIASNLETTIITTVGAKVEKAGEFTVPGRTFAELCAGLSAEKLTLVSSEGSMSISGGKFKGKMAGTPAAEFPKVVADDSAGVVIGLEKKDFQRGVGRTVIASATDESRAVLTGVLFSLAEGLLTMAATDGFRLSVEKIKAKGPARELKFIVPAKALTEVNRLLEESGDFKLTYLEDSGQVVFDLGEKKIFTRLISGNFPDFEKIIPANSTVQLTTTTEELSKAIKLASIFARDSANIVKLKIAPRSSGTQNSKLKISANAPEVGENESEIDVTMEKGGDEEFAVAFNYRYLLDLFAAVGNTEISIEFNGPLAAGVFRLPKDSNFLHIIMPVRVQG